MDAGRFEDACPKFEESLRLDHGMGTQFNLAHCWDKLGRTASAWALFLDVAAAARAGNQADRERAARDRASTIEPKLSRLKITVSEPVEEMRVLRGEQEVGPAAWGSAVPVDPGQHTIVVTAPGKREWSEKIEVPAEPETVSVSVPALEDLPAAEVEAAVAPTETAPAMVGAETSSAGGGQQLAAYVVGGAGVAALAAGTVFMVQSRSDNSEAKELCRGGDEGNQCPSEEERRQHRTLVDDAKQKQLFAIIGFGVGGAAIVAAAVLYLTADDDGSSESAGVSVAPLLAGDVWGASLSGRF